MDTNDYQNQGTPLGQPIGTPQGTPPGPPPDMTQRGNETRPYSMDEDPGTVAADSSYEEATQMAGSRTSSQRNQPKKKGSKTWLIALIALLVCAGIGAGVYFFLNQKSSRHSSDDDDDDEDEEVVDEDDDDDDDAYDMNRRRGNGEETDRDRNGDEEENNEGSTTNRRENTGNDDEGTPTTPTGPQQMVLAGDADGYPMTLTLTEGANGNLTGTYKNETSGVDMQVSGTKNNDVIALTGRGGGTTYSFRIVPEGHIYTGTLITGDGQKKELHLALKR